MKTISAPFGAATQAKRSPGNHSWRIMTFDEVLAGTRTEWVLTPRGTVISARTNGAMKLWKTRPRDLRIPMKYGLYECFYIDFRDGEPGGCKFVVPIP